MPFLRRQTRTLDPYRPISDDPLNDGLISRFQVVPHFMGGSVWRDLVRHRSAPHDGTLTGMDPATDWVGTTRPGGWGALDFDGTDDYVNTTFQGVGGNNPRTITAWIKHVEITGVSQDSGAIAAWGEDTNNFEKWHFRINDQDNNGTIGALRTEIQGTYKIAETPVDDGEWHFVASVFDGTDMLDVIHYVDRNLEGSSDDGGSGTVNTATGSDPVSIGARDQTGLNKFFNGQIDDVRIYDRALSASEVLRLYHTSRQRFDPTLRWLKNRVILLPAATGTTFTETGSGGASLGGAASVASTFAPTPSGGAVVAGVATQAMTFAPSPSGGAVIAGQADDVWTFTDTASGGAVVSGEAVDTTTTTHTGSGGVSLAGTGTVGKTTSVTASGGTTIAGDATETMTFAPSPSGGVTIAGAADDVLSATETGSGGVIIAGEATDAISGGTTFTETGSGGATIAGAADVAATYGPAASGGVAISGQATESMTFGTSPSGGISLAGEAVHTASFTDTASGGATIAGTAGAAASYVDTASGGVTIAGSGTPAQTHSIAAAGGVAIAGDATETMTFGVTASGGVTIAGEAGDTISMVNTGSGGVAIGGTADVESTGDPEETRRAGALSGLSAITGVGIFGVIVE